MNGEKPHVNEPGGATIAIVVRFLLAGLVAVSSFCVSMAREQTRMVKIGYCATLTEIDAVKLAGFDYVELRTSEIAALSKED